MIDLRSDTVTLPTAEMREAMARAELGDDVYGEDPTVNRLEAMAAATMGKEAAMLVASGTMGNLTAMLAHCARGTKALLGARAHTYLYEAGGAAALGGVVMTPSATPTTANLTLDELRANSKRRPTRISRRTRWSRWKTRTTAAAAKRSSSRIWRRSRNWRVATISPVHLDGARIFNAALALETSASVSRRTPTRSRSASPRDSPVRSARCSAGSARFIERARRMRKMLGGGMRQAGIIAAAGIVALTRWSIASPRTISMRARWPKGSAASPGCRCVRRTGAPTWCCSRSKAAPSGRPTSPPPCGERGVLVGARSPVDLPRRHALRNRAARISIARCWRLPRPPPAPRVDVAPAHG